MNIRFGYVRTMTGKFKSRKTKALKCRLLCRDCDVNLIVMKRKPDYSTLTGFLSTCIIVICSHQFPLLNWGQKSNLVNFVFLFCFVLVYFIIWGIHFSWGFMIDDKFLLIKIYFIQVLLTYNKVLSPSII